MVDELVRVFAEFDNDSLNGIFCFEIGVDDEDEWEVVRSELHGEVIVVCRFACCTK